MTAKILIVEDNREVRLAAHFVLQDFGFDAVEVDNPQQAQQWLQHQHADLILLDMNFTLDSTSGEEGLRFLRWKQQHAATIPVVAMTAWSNTELVVTAMQLGANDFVEKPWDNQRLRQVIVQQLQVNQLTKQVKTSTPASAEQLIWQSPAMQAIINQLQAVAKSDANILLLGENGTGKSQLAYWVHQQSTAAQGPFVATNMAAIPESLFESELFGHKKGAFTDAKEARIGRFEQAQHGTLFLDELASLPLTQQAKLLRVLESGEFEAIGDNKTQSSNARIISASNADFAQLIRAGGFRQDLFFRLNTLTFTIPPLRDRTEDILPQAELFIANHCRRYSKPQYTLSQGATALLLDYHWPGNSRELNHVLERAVLLSQNQVISATDINLDTTQLQPQSHYSSDMTLADIEKQHIKNTLHACSNNKAQAANRLGITKQSLYRRLEKYALL
ncbi:sigma-54-dependent transcriptional regulator [Pseudoalteromonas sp. T1lg65]|uniref:sigma-54-dependent transcriptional regulator n=1 Tax=Pseudoalteromonas sp. T1lg65 TaxID=2077101 RepID=UPI003F79A8FC